MDDFEKYDREVAERVKENNEMIALFQSCLEEKGPRQSGTIWETWSCI